MERLNASEPSPLTSCESEPIHLVSAIQPFGFLLSVTADWIVVRASENIQSYLGVRHEQIVGQRLSAHMPSELLHDIRGRLQITAGPGIVERLFGRRCGPNETLFDVAVHRAGNEIVLEFETTHEGSGASLGSLRSMLARVEAHQSPQALYREVARQVRALTGYDRVMVYRFDDDGAGEVVAESAQSGLSPYLGLHYPASDIPAQARALYERNFIRIICDVDAVPVRVSPVLSPEGVALDLSMSILRSVSPIHIEYLRNMGVQSSMSISILQAGRLWGLIACHHGAPRHVGFEKRSAAELFGQMFSYLLEVRQRADEAAYETRARAMHDRIAAAFADPEGTLRDVPEFLASSSDYIASDGIGVYHAGEVSLNGLTPTRAEFLQLVSFLNKTAAGGVFSTHRLSEVFPPAADYVVRAAGILSIPILRTPRDYLIFFRREIAETITWAGEPAKVEAVGPHGVRLTPRKSFEAWQELVRNQSARWAKGELRAAEALRVTLVELLLRMADYAQADRTGAAQRKEVLIAELNHRVRNILGLVRGLITQTAASAGDLRVFVDGLDDRIRSLARAHDLLTATNFEAASLHDLLRTEVDTYIQAKGRLILLGPDVILVPKAFSTMALVVHELVTNARKYGALGIPNGQVTIASAVDEIGSVSVSWRETGGPRVTPPTRRGFGTTILEQAVPFEVNGTSSAKYLPTGFVLDLVLPAAVAEAAYAPATDAVPRHSREADIDQTALANLLNASLVVEDNLFIALDVEDMLRALGATTIEVVRSVAEALAAIAERPFSFALLDVNLGDETSLPIARALQIAKIPFAFGTGYGEALAMADIVMDVPVLSKPYHRAALTEILIQLLPEQGTAAGGDHGA